METVLSTIGFRTPLNRFVITTGSLAIAEWMIKPSYAFTSSGQMRPWKLVDKTSAEATYTPVFTFPLIAGIIMSTFV